MSRAELKGAFDVAFVLQRVTPEKDDIRYIFYLPFFYWQTFQL